MKITAEISEQSRKDIQEWILWYKSGLLQVGMPPDLVEANMLAITDFLLTGDQYFSRKKLIIQ